MKKIAYLTGTRAEFGLMTSVLEAIDKNPGWKLILLATGMHLMDEFGSTIKEVDKKFKIAGVIEAEFEKDDRESMARFTAQCTAGVVETLIKYKPDVVMVLGDRGEQLAMATAAAYLNIPIVHLSGGDLTTTVDDKARHAISMLADWHLPNNKKSEERLISMGIAKEKVKNVGASGLDQIKKLDKAKKKDLIVVLQHPDEQENQAAKQIEATLEAVVSFGLRVRVIYPNADAGGRAQIRVIERFAKQYPRLVKTHKSLGNEDYLKLLQTARVLVGNSSSGIVESPTFQLGLVNVGPRQKGRLRAGNVIEADYQVESIKEGVEKVLNDKAFQGKLKKIKNPYGDGRTAERVLRFLNKTFNK